MDLYGASKNYFNSFAELRKKGSNKPLAILKIISMFTVVVPLFMAGALLIGRITHKKPENAKGVNKVASTIFNNSSSVLMDSKSGGVLHQESNPTEPLSRSVEINDLEIERKVSQIAIDQGYGYKAANLIVLRQLANDMSAQFKRKIVVPAFFPVSDQSVRSILGDKALEIDRIWSQFQEEFRENQLSEKAKDSLGQIREILTNHFKSQTFDTPGLSDWLRETNPKTLIIRSTGKEDSEAGANAGGNESIPYVPLDSISEKVGEVLASYFSERSILQRQKAKDVSLTSNEPPFLPVLIQEMVLEADDPTDDEVLRSGVILTHMQDQAQNVTVIQTGLGQNEGIVSSRVAVDSYFVDSKGKIHTVIRDKKSRIAKKGVIENGEHLSRKATLKPSEIRDLRRIAKRVERHYGGKALNLEYSMQNGTLYLFQARPNVQSNLQSPSYLDLSKTKDVSKKNRLQTPILIDADRRVKRITSEKHVIFEDNLIDAFQAYLKSPEEVGAIFIRKSAPSTSHEAIELLAAGITVSILSEPSDFENAQSIVRSASETHPVLLDPQHQVMIATTELQTTDDLERDGNVSYPILRELSIPMVTTFKIEDLQNSEIRYQNLQEHLLEGEKFLSSQGDDPFTLNRLLDLMATGEAKEAKRALATSLKLLHSTLRSKIAQGYKPEIEILVNLFQYVLNLAESSILPTIEIAPPHSMERLYPIKFLEAAIFQQPGADALMTDSFAKALHWEQIQRSSNKELHSFGIQHPTPQLIRLFDLGKKASYSNQAIQCFGKYLATLNPQQARELHPLVESLADQRLLESWFNHEFQITMNGIDPIDSAKNALKENKETIEWIQRYRGILKSNRVIQQFSDPSFVLNNIQKLKDEYIATFKELKQQYDAASVIGKGAILNFIHETVNCYDVVIKAVTGSTLFPEDNVLKAHCFASLLEGYFEMMVCVTSLTETSENYYLFTQVGDNTRFGSASIATYIDYLKKGVSKEYLGNSSSKKNIGFIELLEKVRANQLENLDSQFMTSSAFSVELITLGSKLDLKYGVQWPASLEEYFTTFHQNMEFMLSFKKSRIGMGRMVDENAVNTVHKISYNFSLSTIQSGANGVELNFSAPLRSHSASLKVIYDPTNPQQNLKCKLRVSGQNESMRWNRVAGLMQLALCAGVQGKVSFSPGLSKSSAGYVEMEFDLQNERQEAIIKKMCTIILKPEIEFPTLQAAHELFGIGDLTPALFQTCLWYGFPYISLALGDEKRSVKEKVECLIHFFICLTSFKPNTYFEDMFDYIDTNGISDFIRSLDKETRSEILKRVNVERCSKLSPKFQYFEVFLSS